MPWGSTVLQNYCFPLIKEGILACTNPIRLYDATENCVKYGDPESITDPVFEAGSVKITITFRDTSTDQYTFREVRVLGLFDSTQSLVAWHVFDSDITKNSGQTLTITITISIYVG